MGKIESILNTFEGMSLLELNEFIEILEKKYKLNERNIVKETNDNQINKKYSLFLIEIGNNKISVIKLIREFNNLGLKEAKDLVESVPVLIKDNIELKLIEDIKKKLENLGAKVDVK